MITKLFDHEKRIARSAEFTVTAVAAGLTTSGAWVCGLTPLLPDGCGTMDVIIQDENSVGPIGSAFGDTQRSAKSHSGRSGVPLGKAAISSKTPGRKAFGNITNVSGTASRKAAYHRVPHTLLSLCCGLMPRERTQIDTRLFLARSPTSTSS